MQAHPRLISSVAHVLFTTSDEDSLWLRVEFFKPTLSTGHCELKAGSVMKLSLGTEFIR